MESEEKKLYSMDELASAAGISYSTLSGYLRLHGERIPSEKRGQLRFFPPRAVEIVREIVRENAAQQGRNVRRKTREKAASDEAMAWIERANRGLDAVTEYLDRACQLLLHNSGSVVVSLRTLAPGLVFRQPVEILLEPDGPDCVARLFEVNLCADGGTRQEAMDNLRSVIVETYRELLSTEPEHWTQELRERAALVDMVRAQVRKRRRNPKPEENHEEVASVSRD